MTPDGRHDDDGGDGRVVDGSGVDGEPVPVARHRVARWIGLGLLAIVLFLLVTLFTGFPPLHMASASDLIAFRDRINRAAANQASCPGFEVSPERLHPAGIDWIGRHIRLRHAEGEHASIPASLRYTTAEKEMLGPGPLLASVGCPAVVWRTDGRAQDSDRCDRDR